MEISQPTRTDIYAMCNEENCHGIVYSDGHLVDCLCNEACCLQSAARLADCRVFAFRASNGDVVVVDFDDKRRVGEYEWRKHRSGHYHTTDEGGDNIYIHRLITDFRWQLVDHRNREKWDNRKCNLRESDPRRNRHNISGRKGASSRYIGVDRVGGRWRGRVQERGGKTLLNLGRFDTEDEAGRAVMAARRELLGEHAYVDDIEASESDHGRQQQSLGDELGPEPLAQAEETRD